MKRRSVLCALALALVLATAATALAATAIKGATYSGRLKPSAGVPLSAGTPIDLAVSAGGKVTVGMESFPLFCEGGGPPQTIRFKPATVTGGKFKTTGTEVTEKQFGGGLTAKATVTGKFLAGGKEKGGFEVEYTKAPSCSGKTTYRTAVAPN